MKRTPKSKVEIAKSMKVNSDTLHLIEVTKKVFPLLKNNKTIYDGQTAVNAVSGYLKAGVEEEILKIKVSDVVERIKENLKSQKKSEIKTSMENILKVIENESANDMANLLERIGAELSKLGSYKYLKGPMSDVTQKDLLGR